jgi:hypothetical protein
MVEIVPAEDLVDYVNYFKLPKPRMGSLEYLHHVFRTSAERCKVQNALTCTDYNYFGLVVKEDRVVINPVLRPLESLSSSTRSKIRKRGFSYLTTSFVRVLCNGVKYKIKAEIQLGGEIYLISCNLVKTKEVQKLEKLSLKFKL